MSAKLETFNANWALQQPSCEPVWVVEDLISSGVHILAGSPKVGKSWLVLALGLCITEGKPFWGYATRQSPVLYLCLEDTVSRIQRRLWALTDEARDDFHFALSADKIGDGLMEQLEGFLAAEPTTKLIVIDTLQVIRGGESSKNQNAYAADYNQITALKKFADEHELAIIVIHHTRKQETNDMVEAVSGTHGISGSADSTMNLTKRNRSSEWATFCITGRDIEYQELKLRFRDCRWDLIEKTTQDEFEERDVPAAVLCVIDFMTAHPGSWEGTATKLLKDAEVAGVTVAVLGKYLAQYQEYLADRSINYSRRHEREGNILSLDHIALGEGSESCGS